MAAVHTGSLDLRWRLTLRHWMMMIAVVAAMLGTYAHNVLEKERAFHRGWANYRAAMAARAAAQVDWHRQRAEQSRQRAAALNHLAMTRREVQSDPRKARALSQQAIWEARHALFEIQQARQSQRDHHYWADPRAGG